MISKSLMTWDIGKVFEVAFSDNLMRRKYESRILLSSFGGFCCLAGDGTSSPPNSANCSLR